MTAPGFIKLTDWFTKMSFRVRPYDILAFGESEPEPDDIMTTWLILRDSNSARVVMESADIVEAMIVKARQLDFIDNMETK